MKESIAPLLDKIRPLGIFAKRNAPFIFIIVLLSVYIYLVRNIGTLITDEPTQAQVDTKLKPISKLKIDQDAVNRMNQLEAQNIEVKSLFEQARQNPFSE